MGCCNGAMNTHSWLIMSAHRQYKHSYTFMNKVPFHREHSWALNMAPWQHTLICSWLSTNAHDRSYMIRFHEDAYWPKIMSLFTAGSEHYWGLKNPNIWTKKDVHIPSPCLSYRLSKKNLKFEVFWIFHCKIVIISGWSFWLWKIKFLWEHVSVV